MLRIVLSPRGTQAGGGSKIGGGGLTEVEWPDRSLVKLGGILSRLASGDRWLGSSFMRQRMGICRVSGTVIGKEGMDHLRV